MIPQTPEIDWSAMIGKRVNYQKPEGPPGPIPDGWWEGEVAGFDGNFITISDQNGHNSLFPPHLVLSRILFV